MQPKDKWCRWEIPEKQIEAEGTTRVFYEAKLVSGESSHPKNRKQTVGIGSIIKEESISTLHKLLRVTAWLL